MNIVFLIGNGFDIKQGLKTSYKEFYKWLKARTDDRPDEKAWLRFKDDIDPDLELWADLEMALGQYLANVDSDKDATEIITRLRQRLQEYICRQDSEFKIEDGLSIDPADLYNPISFFPEGTKRRIQSLKNNFENTYVDVNVILFNYTTSLERLLEWDGTSQRHTIQNYTGSIPKDISAIEHIHGFCDERARLAVGIDNKAQIANPVLAENPKICRRYVKDEFNSCYELGHAQRCAEWIDNADVICIYGMSLGESDQRWWDRIAKRLTVSPRPLLFYFVHRDMELRGNNGPEYQEQVDEDRQYLMSRLGLLGRSDTTGLSTRIFVSYSPAIFTPRPSTF